jgi:hypothetical protein
MYHHRSGCERDMSISVSQEVTGFRQPPVSASNEASLRVAVETVKHQGGTGTALVYFQGLTIKPSSPPSPPPP